MASNKKATQHPLMAAMIASLPMQGAQFARDQRVSWLKMIALTLDNVYGAVPTIAIDHAAPVQLSGAPAGAGMADAGGQVVSLDAMREAVAPAGEPFKKLQRYTLFIDKEGYAKHISGERILPSQVNDTLFDLRGELGDLGAIIWADGSMGTRGLQLEISASEAA